MTQGSSGFRSQFIVISILLFLHVLPKYIHGFYVISINRKNLRTNLINISKPYLCSNVHYANIHCVNMTRVTDITFSLKLNFQFHTEISLN